MLILCQKLGNVEHHAIRCARWSSRPSVSSCLPSSSVIRIRNSVSETSAGTIRRVVADSAQAYATCDFVWKYRLEHFALFLLVFDAHREECDLQSKLRPQSLAGTAAGKPHHVS
jgi:hypothetical protein